MLIQKDQLKEPIPKNIKEKLYLQLKIKFNPKIKINQSKSNLKKLKVIILNLTNYYMAVKKLYS